MKRTSRYIRLIAASVLIGFGACWGFQLITTVHGLLGDSNESLYFTFICAGYVIGLFTAGLWLFRRLRGLPVRWWERTEFAFAAFFVAYSCYWVASGEMQSFLAFTPDAAARRYADISPAAPYLVRGSIVFHDSRDRILHDSQDRVREYVIMDETGKHVWAIGVYPRFLWWSGAYSMSFEDASSLHK